VCNPTQGIIRVAPDGRHEVFATHAGDHKLACANFGLFDAAGNFFVTDSGQWMKRNGRLYRFTPDGCGTSLAAPFGYANGLALSGDEKTLYVVESDGERIFRFDLATGRHEVFAESVGRMPDGLALDSAGNLYVACYASDDIQLITPAGEQQLFAHDRWAIKLSRPTNLTFRDGWLYVTNLGRQTIVRAKMEPLASRK
ncbi:MAG: SMP-30/gluconolactonase/LRE family protein, partial [Tepidisphaeraceae bacterium]